MAIAPAYRSIAVQAILGPARSTLMPSVLWLGWLDDEGELVAMSGATISHEAFIPTDGGVENVDPIDGGLAGDGWEVAAVGLFADDAGTDLIITATLDTPVVTVEGDPMTFDVGALVFEVEDEGSSE